MVAGTDHSLYLAILEGLQDKIPLTDAQGRLPGSVHSGRSNKCACHEVSVHYQETSPFTVLSTWDMASLLRIRSKNIVIVLSLFAC